MKRFKLIGLWTGIVTVFAALLYPIWLWQDHFVEIWLWEYRIVMGPVLFSWEGWGREGVIEPPSLPGMDAFSTKVALYIVAASPAAGGLWLTLRRKMKI